MKLLWNFRKKGQFTPPSTEQMSIIGSRPTQPAVRPRFPPMLEALENRGLTRTDIFWLAELPKAEQQRLLRELAETGKLPRHASDKRPSTITLPREPRAFAEKVRKIYDKNELTVIREKLFADQDNLEN